MRNAWSVFAQGKAAHALNPQDSVQRVLGCSAAQILFGFLLAGTIGAGSFYLHGYGWLGLFGALALPLGLTQLIVPLFQKYVGVARSWAGLWLLWGMVLAVAIGMGLFFYRNWMDAHGLRGLNDWQLSACIAGIDAMAIAAPFWRDQQQLRALQMAQLRQLALSAELKALQAQVEPHFLYNTLANTRYLVRHDPEKAVQMLDHLIAYLHTALPDMRSSTSTVAREFALAEHYLALMAIRFGTRLLYRVAYAPHLANAALPPLMLMSLVENAVKHGVEPQPGEVCITVLAEDANGELRIAVCDDGFGIASDVLGSGVGLRNVRERLDVMFGDAAHFVLRPAQPKGAQAKFSLPLQLDR